MPKRHRKFNNTRNPPGHNQDPGSGLSTLDNRRALPALPGRIFQKEEAELLQCVTKAPAEPLIGAIPFGPAQNTSISVDISLSPPEVEGRNSRALGMGQKPDGDSHPSSNSINPLRNNNNNISESLLMSAPSPSGGIPIERHFTLANSGIDPTTMVLSGVKTSGRQERTNEPTLKSDTIKPPLIDFSTLNDRIMSHKTFTFSDKILNISQSSYIALSKVVLFMI